MPYRSKPKFDLTGKRFGLLTIVEQVDNVGFSAANRNGFTSWLCRCRCGTETVVLGSNIKRGNTRSCGCEDRRLTAERSTTHGLKNHWLYPTWIEMNQRCLNPECKSFRNYGARKISICDEWRNDDVGCAPAYQTGDRTGLVRFIEWIENNLGPKPEGYSLDRIDNDGNYEPGNLKWSSAKEQRVNQRPRKREAKQKLIFGY